MNGWWWDEIQMNSFLTVNLKKHYGEQNLRLLFNTLCGAVS